MVGERSREEAGMSSIFFFQVIKMHASHAKPILTPDPQHASAHSFVHQTFTQTSYMPGPAQNTEDVPES